MGKGTRQVPRLTEQTGDVTGTPPSANRTTPAEPQISRRCCSTRQAAVKVSPEGGNLITSGAHYLHMSKKDLVEAAVAFYLDARREEMQAGMRELLSELDGSRASRIAMLAGVTRAELDAIGGVEED